MLLAVLPHLQSRAGSQLLCQAQAPAPGPCCLRPGRGQQHAVQLLPALGRHGCQQVGCMLQDGLMHCRVPVSAEHLQVRTREVTPWPQAGMPRQWPSTCSGQQSLSAAHFNSRALAGVLPAMHTSSCCRTICRNMAWMDLLCVGVVCYCMAHWLPAAARLWPTKHVFCSHRKPDRPTACACSHLAPCCRQAGRGCPCQCRPVTHPSGAHQIPLRGLGPHHACNFMQGAGQRAPVACLPRAGEPVKGGVQHWPGWRPQRVQYRWQVEGAGKLQVEALCPCCTGRHACKAVQEACRVERGCVHTCKVWPAGWHHMKQWPSSC